MTDKRLSGSNGVTMRMFQSSCFRTQSSRLWAVNKVEPSRRGHRSRRLPRAPEPVWLWATRELPSVLPLAARSSQRRTARGGARAEP